MIPVKLYKYKPINQQNIDNLKDEVIWFAKPDSFNDPFDCNIKFFGQDQYFKSLPLYVNAIGVSKSNIDAITQIINNGKSTSKPDNEIIILIESELQKQGQTKLQTQIEEYDLRIKEFLQHIGVLSLSEKPDDILMWSHYADYHKGMCLEFTTTIPHGTSELILSNDKFTKKVKYSDYYPSILDMNIFDATNDELIEYLLNQ